jgi:hypothetical protein
VTTNGESLWDKFSIKNMSIKKEALNIPFLLSENESWMSVGKLRNNFVLTLKIRAFDGLYFGEEKICKYLKSCVIKLEINQIYVTD